MHIIWSIEYTIGFYMRYLRELNSDWNKNRDKERHQLIWDKVLKVLKLLSATCLAVYLALLWCSQALLHFPSEQCCEQGPTSQQGPALHSSFLTWNSRVPPSAQRGKKDPQSQWDPGLQEEGCWNRGFCTLNRQRSTGVGGDPCLASPNGFRHETKSPVDMPSASGEIRAREGWELGLPPSSRDKGWELVRRFPGWSREQVPGGQAEHPGVLSPFPHPHGTGSYPHSLTSLARAERRILVPTYSSTKPLNVSSKKF